MKTLHSWALAVKEDLPLFGWGFVWASATYGFFYLVGVMA